jgi:GT2 family glycosyltransferase
VTIVFLVYNRREELRESLVQMLGHSDYDSALVEVVVVDNASEDGAAEMVQSEFPQVRLIRREENCGISGWNDGFAVATGELVLALDDDCYLPPEGLGRAIEAMREHDADLVSFAVAAAERPDYFFNLAYRTGLLSFWGCAVLVRRRVIEEIGGFDPDIFVWAHELEFMLRFFDQGFRHLHLPEIVAVHMKDADPNTHWKEYFGSRAYQFNSRHFAYVAAKHLRARDAFEALVALLVANVRDGIRHDRKALAALRQSLAGFATGLRRRRPVSNAELSRTYRRNFHSFASPWWLSRRPREFLGRPDPSLPPVDERVAHYFRERARFYPERASTLEF